MIIGSFLGDFVKGKQYQNFDKPIAQGILLHREIDHFTDHHPVFLQSKRRLQTKHNHYSGVIVDIFYDHFLAKNWSEYSTETLSHFASQVYGTLQSQQDLLPIKAQRVLHYMSEHNWLVNYAGLKGIRRTLQGMESRSPYPNQMSQGVNDLTDYYEAFSKEFTEFFQDLQQHSQAWWFNRK